ncbi:MAG: hypothetical protein Q4G19_01610 [Clostridia bacterium]|nr:hypothetical protein [Clostridia bacterium]
MKKILTAILALALILTLTTVSLADGLGFAAYQDKFGEDEEDYEYTAKVAVGRGDVDGHVGAGETLYIRDDGSTGTVNGVSATTAAEIEAVKVDGKLRVGNKEYNTQVGGGVTVAKAGANAGATVGMDKGKVVVSATAGAEANIVEASAQASSTIGGVEFGVKGSVKVGVGVKAKVGYSNGKLKCELGAALGIGGSVGFEVDVGAIADKAATLGKKVWNALKFW